MDWKYYMPLLLVIISNLIYHNMSKNTPTNVNPFLSLSVTYIVSTIITISLYFTNGGNLSKDVNKLNWISAVLGVSIVGIEFGYIMMYRNGWQISRGSLIANISNAMLFIVIGVFWYKELITPRQVIGILFCGIGLLLVNYK